MPLSTAVISYDIADLAGVDFDSRRTKVWATTNVASNTVIDTDGNKIRLGSAVGTVATDGTGAISVWIPGTGSNPTTWQTSVHVDYPDRNTSSGRRTTTFGPFTITATANLADLVAQMPVQPEYASDLTQRVAVLESAGGGALVGAWRHVTGEPVRFPQGPATSGRALDNTAIRFTPTDWPEPVSITALSVGVVTPIATAVVTCAFFSFAGNNFTQLSPNVTFDASTTGVKTSSLTFTIPAGTVFLGFGANVAGVSINGHSDGVSLGGRPTGQSAANFTGHGMASLGVFSSAFPGVGNTITPAFGGQSIFAYQAIATLA